MDDKPRCNLANMARKVLRRVYKYIKVDNKSGQAQESTASKKSNFVQLMQLSIWYTNLKA